MLSPTAIGGGRAQHLDGVEPALRAGIRAADVEEHERRAGHGREDCSDQQELPMDHGRQTFPRVTALGHPGAVEATWATARPSTPAPAGVEAGAD